jgi:FkbM family methyltransferase
MLLTPRDWVQSHIFVFNAYEKAESDFILSLLSNQDTFIDIGANVGYYSMLASKKITKGKIYSFEPEINNYQRLKDNIKLNGALNITAVHKACSDQNGMVVLSVAKDDNKGLNSIFLSDEYKSHTQEIEAVTLDSFVKSNNISNISLIKMDVEGAEFIALKGMKEVLTNLKPALVVEIVKNNLEAAGTSVEEFYTYLYRLGYKSYQIDGKHGLIPAHNNEEGRLIYFRYEK